MCAPLTACDSLRPPAREPQAASSVYGQAIAVTVSAMPSPSPSPRPAATPARTTPSPSPSPLPPEPSPPPPEELIITCIGDCTLGGDPRLGQLDAFRRTLEANAGDLGYFFSNALPYTAGPSTGLTIVNLEGPLTAHNAGADKPFAFRGDPSFAGILSRGGVGVVSLANNHAMDYGERGYADTLAALAAEGIAAADIGRPVIYETGEWTIGVAASKFLTRGRLAALKDDIAYLREAGCGAVVAVIHWGEEGAQAPTPQIRAYAHALIDAGADLIVGHHPHVLQGIEQYNGRVIAYSLGNFVFGGNRNPYERETAVLQQRFVVREGRLEPEGFRVVPFAVSGVRGNDYRPVELEGAAAQTVYDAINRRGALMPEWVTVSEGWLSGDESD